MMPVKTVESMKNTHNKRIKKGTPKAGALLCGRYTAIQGSETYERAKYRDNYSE